MENTDPFFVEASTLDFHNVQSSDYIIVTVRMAPTELLDLGEEIV